MVGPITDVDVALQGVGHKWPDDLDVLVVSPSGDKVMLMSDACGEDDIEDYNWFFSQQAPRAMSDDSADCGANVYRPTNYVGPTPGLPTTDFWNYFHPEVQPPHGASLNNFNNENPNGIWKLFVDDDDSLNGGDADIELGWSLAIETRAVDTAIPGSGTLGAANPYPAVRTVSGETGVITDVNVSINGIWHERPDDLDMLLVGPHGQRTVLMSDACGTFEVASFGWFWDDEAAAPMPDGDGTNVCATTSHRPTDHEPDDAWPPPAPLGPYPAALSTFDLTDPNGDWRLFVNDDSSDKVGFFTNRFQLVMTTRPKATVAFTQSQAEVAEGTTHELTLTRTGPATLGAGSVTVTTVPATATAESDFTALSTVVDFAPGEAQKTVAVDALSDATTEPDEAYTVSIGTPTGDAAVPTPSSVTVTIPAPPAPGGGPGGGGGGASAGDATPPSFVGSARAIPRTFAVGRARHAARAVQGTRRKVKRGTTFHYALSEAARVMFAIERKRAGRPSARNARSRRAPTAASGAARAPCASVRLPSGRPPAATGSGSGPHRRQAAVAGPLPRDASRDRRDRKRVGAKNGRLPRRETLSGAPNSVLDAGAGRGSATSSFGAQRCSAQHRRAEVLRDRVHQHDVRGSPAADRCAAAYADAAKPARS